MKKELKVMTDEEVEILANKLKAHADKEVEPQEENIPENELIDPAADNVVVFLKKRINKEKQ